MRRDNPRAACAATIAPGHGGLEDWFVGRQVGAVALFPDGVTAVRLKDNPNPVPVVENAFSGYGKGIAGLTQEPQTGR